MPEPLLKTQALRGMTESLTNGAKFLRSAQLLLSSAPPRFSAVLSILGMEETAKALILLIAAEEEMSGLSSGKLAKLWKSTFLHHETKLWLLFHRGWKEALYVRKRKHIEPDGASGHVRRLLRAYRCMDEYLESSAAGSLGELKLQALYVNMNRNTQKVSSPRAIPKAVAQALLVIGESLLKDARLLRNTYRRCRGPAFAEQVFATMFSSELLRQFVDQSPQPTGDPRNPGSISAERVQQRQGPTDPV